MEAMQTLAFPPMGTAPDADMLDDTGALTPTAWPVWLRRLKAAGWTTRMLAERFGARSIRHVERWLAGSRVPSQAVRRLAWEALAAPIEAEAVRLMEARAGALQARKARAAADALKALRSRTDKDT